MDKIRSHPFYTRKSPKPLPFYVEPPTPEMIDRCVSAEDDIDPDILANLRTLWNGASEDDVIDALVSKEKTWEKVFYFLLMRYRTRHSENFEGDGAKRTSSTSRPPKKVIEAAPPGIKKSMRSTQSLSEIANGAEIAPTPIAKTGPSTHRASRPAPAPPVSTAVITPASPRSRPPLPHTPAPSAVSHAPMLFDPRGETRNNDAHTLPTVYLQQPTPSSTERMHDMLPPVPENTEDPASPSPAAISAPLKSPAITIPDVDSPVMRHFFHDVVDKLQAMETALKAASPDVSPVIPGPPSPALSSSSGNRISFSPVVKARDQFRTSTQAEQFADAEATDEVVAEMYMPIAKQLQQQVTAPLASPRAGPSATGTRPLSIRKPPPAINVPASPLQARRAPQPGSSPNPARPPITRPTSTYSHPTTQKVNVDRRGVSVIAQPTSPTVMPGAYFDTSDDKENYASPPQRKSILLNGSGYDKHHTMGLAIDGVGDRPHSALIEQGMPSPALSQSSKLKRKSKQMSPNPMFASPLLSAEVPASPKGSWFSNLFNWNKPVVSRSPVPLYSSC